MSLIGRLFPIFGENCRRAVKPRFALISRRAGHAERDAKSLIRLSVNYNDAYRNESAAVLPSADEARRLLRSRLIEGQCQQDHSAFDAVRTGWRKVVFSVAAVTACLAIGISIGRGVQGNVRRSEIGLSMPNSRLTPGATVELTRQAVCGEANVKNKPVPVCFSKRFFRNTVFPLHHLRPTRLIIW